MIKDIFITIAKIFTIGMMELIFVYAYIGTIWVINDGIAPDNVFANILIMTVLGSLVGMRLVGDI